jgi:membrane peptidoglycan carboxypeptidase
MSSAAVPHPRRRLLARLLLWLIVLLGLAFVAVLVWEIRHAELQSRWIHRYASTLTWDVQPGPSDALVFPKEGPFDKRLGYAYLPLLLERLQARDFVIDAQARFSPDMLDHVGRGLFPPYQEKLLAGLVIDDCRGETMFAFSYPSDGYALFGDIPPVIVDALLYIENRGLLDLARPRANPAVDWPRLAVALTSQAQKALDLQHSPAGGSTLATQIEKFRHSPDGMTLNAPEKLRQLASASVRAYRDGRNTLDVRREIVRNYLNTVPLSAAPNHGEVHGIADGLRVWFGADFDAANLALDPMRAPDVSIGDRGLALRQVLGLMIAQRRPSYYLAQGRGDLAALADAHLRLLARDGLISSELAEAALAARLTFRDWQLDPGIVPIDADRGVTVARRRLASLLSRSLYDLDRLDLVAGSTLHTGLQQSVTEHLRRLGEADFARAAGLFGDRLLSEERVADVRYSFTLFERDGGRFAVRVQTDNTDQPFDINEDSKLELGSTAKLRVLATYLEIIAEVFERHAGRAAEALREFDADDPLSRWTLERMVRHPEADLPAMLDAALERRYSANPNERFFTGGGLHTFGNFRREDSSRNPTVRESMRESINLPFVRLMRDIVRYTIAQSPGATKELLVDGADPRRREYLEAFADREGTTFLLRFWRKYRSGSGADEQLQTFMDGVRKEPTRVAAVHRFLQPEASPEAFRAFMAEYLPGTTLTERQLDELYRRYGPGQFSLSDQAYVARVHPLELWLLHYLLQRPGATQDEIVADSVEQRQEVYGWLFRSRHRSARDSRVRIMLEVEAFLDIHRRWRRLGYPFGHLVPSLATALGSSGDRPAALAELMGIILNDGVRLPTVRIDRLHFATDTPYETGLTRVGEQRRVMQPEVAAALGEVLSQVVDIGTARRLQGSFVLADGQRVVMGGKTGTGDNRIQTVVGGRIVASRAMNRTATFVFHLGPDHFGTLTAYVPGRAAEGFRFTSALPVQVLRSMAPILTPHLDPGSRMCLPARDPFKHADEPR